MNHLLVNLHTTIEELQDLGVSNAQILMYFWIVSRYPKGTTADQIARERGMSVSVAHRMLKVLKRKCLMEERPDPASRKRLYIPDVYAQ